MAVKKQNGIIIKIYFLISTCFSIHRIMLLLCLLFVVIGLNIALDDSLVAMDKHLTSLLVEPQPGKGAQLLTDSELLCKKLDEVSDLVDEKKPEGTEIYKQFEKAGGLKFINATYSPDILKERYKFSEDDLAYLSTTIREMKSIWKCIEVLLNVSLPDSGEHFYEKMAERIRQNERLRGELEDESYTFGPSEVYDED